MNTKLFGQMLLEKGYVTRDQLLEGLAEQRRSTGTLGDLAIAVGMLSVQDVDTIHLRQQARNESFSQAAVNLGLLSERQLADLLHPDSAETLLLGQILTARGVLTEETLEEALSLHSSLKQEDEKDLLKPFRQSELGEVAALCVSVMKSVFKQTVGTPVSCQPIPAGKAVSAGDPVWAQVIGHPEESFILAIQTGERDACTLAGAVLGGPVDEFDELARDALAEFLNVITGHVCGNLTEVRSGLSASTPAVQDAEGFSRVAEPGVAVLGTGDELELTFIVARPAECLQITFGAETDSSGESASAPPSEESAMDRPDGGVILTKATPRDPSDAAPLSAVHPFETQISLS